MKKILIIMLALYSCFVISYNKQHVALFKKKAAKKEKVNVSCCDFRGANLNGISCPGAQLSGANFSMPVNKGVVGGIISIPNKKTDLTGANFANSECVSTNFSDAILINANFAGADIKNASFAKADLTGAKFDNVKNAEFATFLDAIMPDGSACNGAWTNKAKTATLYCNAPKNK